MPEVRCQIMRWADDGFPGWVEAALTDVHGVEWRFKDKAPVFTTEPLSAETRYPVAGAIRCEIVERIDHLNHVVVDTARPDSVAAVDDVTTTFVVLNDLVTP